MMLSRKRTLMCNDELTPVAIMVFCLLMVFYKLHMEKNAPEDHVVITKGKDGRKRKGNQDDIG